MSRPLLIFIVVTVFSVAAVEFDDGNRNYLHVANAFCNNECVGVAKFVANGLCMRFGEDSSYIATCNKSSGAYRLQQFSSDDCDSGTAFRDISNATKMYHGTVGAIYTYYTKVQGEVKFCADSECQANCVDYKHEATQDSTTGLYNQAPCHELTINDRSYYVSAYYANYPSGRYIYTLFTSNTECHATVRYRRGRLPIYHFDGKDEEQCISFTPNFDTRCVPVTETTSPTATGTVTVTVPHTATVTVVRHTATATVPPTTTTSTTSTTTAPTSMPTTSTTTAPTSMPTTSTTTAPTSMPATAPITTNASAVNARGDSAAAGEAGGSKGVCVPCIVVPIVVVLLLLCICLIIWLLCCRRRDEVKVLDDVEFSGVPNPLHEANGENNYYPEHTPEPHTV